MTSSFTNFKEWAREEWMNVDFGDSRLNNRAINIGMDFFRNPFLSPPKMFKSPKKLKGFYRFLDSDKVNHDSLIGNHIAQSREKMRYHNIILAVHDFTTLAYGREYKIEGSYDVGNIQGAVVLNSLAVIPFESYGVVDGLLNQIVVKRKPKDQRTRQDCESRAWKDSIATIIPPPDATIVDVMDRGADALEIMHCSKSHNHEFIIRAKQNRFIQDVEHKYLFDFARAIPNAGRITIEVKRNDAKKCRLATLNISYSNVTLDSPKNNKNVKPLSCAIIHACEVKKPKDEFRIEWFLLTSLPVVNLDDALRYIQYYSFRWIIEEYHKCLKTGFRLEKTQLHTLKRIENLLAFVSVSSVKLLQLRDSIRRDPQSDANKHLDKTDIFIIKKLCNINNEIVTIDQFLRGVAQLGGFLNRKSDGNPGWQSIWEGWKYFMTFKEGIDFYKKTCG